MGNTQKLSDFLAAVKYEDLPAEVIEQVKRLTIHTVGVSIASDIIGTTQKAKKLAEDKGGTPEATVWGGSGLKINAEDAAFANATQADVLDWEDCSWTGHPSAGVIAAAFSTAEARNKSGKDFITAVVAGYEGYQRIAMAVQPSPAYLKKHSWGLSSWQIFGSSLAAAKIYGFDGDRFNQTIGATVYVTPVAVGLHAAGPAKSDIYHFAHGTDASNGIFAAKIAEAGYDNGRDYLDGERGYWSMVSDSDDPTWYTLDLGGRWLINETYIKHWPANMWVQTPLEIIDAIYKEHPFTADQVKKISLSPYNTLTGSDYLTSTKTTLDAQFNAAFCIAAYILNPVSDAKWFTEDQLERKEILGLIAKFEEVGETITPSTNFAVFQKGSFPEMTMRVELNDGTILEKTIVYPKGHPRNNTTLEEEYELFERITTPVIGKENAKAFIQAVDNLETLGNIGEAAQYLIK